MKKPIYSIIIPVAPDRTAPILKYIKKQKFDKKKYEVIVIKGTNVPENRNNGFKKSKGQWIIYLDDDAYIETDFLDKVDSFIKRNPSADIIGGPQLTPHDDGPFARATGKVLASKICNPGAYKRYRRTSETLEADNSYVSGALMIIKRKVLKEIDFDESQYPADDVKFIDTAKKKGYVVGSSPDIYIYHQRRPTAKGLFKQYFDYGKAGAELQGGRGLMFTLMGLFSLYWLIFLIGAAVLYKTWLINIWVIPALAYILLFLFTDLANLNFRCGPIMFITHFAYGLGILSVWWEKALNIMMALFLANFLLLFWPFMRKSLESECDDWGYMDYEPTKPSFKDKLAVFGWTCLWVLLLPLLIPLFIIGLVVFVFPLNLTFWLSEKWSKKSN